MQGGAPVLFYGDEFAMRNDDQFYEEYREKTGIDDSRYRVRGRVDWAHIDEEVSRWLILLRRS